MSKVENNSKSRMARMFWEHGLRSVRAIAEAEKKDLVPILMLAQPRKMKQEPDAVEKYMRKLDERSGWIIDHASRLWGEFSLCSSQSLFGCGSP
jgi:hypothetical protein